MATIDALRASVSLSADPKFDGATGKIKPEDAAAKAMDKSQFERVMAGDGAGQQRPGVTGTNPGAMPPPPGQRPVARR